MIATVLKMERNSLLRFIVIVVWWLTSQASPISNVYSQSVFSWFLFFGIV